MRLVGAAELTAAELERVREIYFDAFEPHLRAPMENLLADQVLVLTDGAPRGFAVVRALGDTGWVYLRYFAVGERGGGLGAQLWTQLRAAMTAAGYTRIIYDVEDPAQHGIAPEEELIRRRRITFYQRLGAEVLAVNGYLPPQGSAGYPMLLMAADYVDHETPAANDLERITIAVYEHRYGIAPTDPVVERTLRLSGVRG